MMTGQPLLLLLLSLVLLVLQVLKASLPPELD